MERRVRHSNPHILGRPTLAVETMAPKRSESEAGNFDSLLVLRLPFRIDATSRRASIAGCAMMPHLPRRDDRMSENRDWELNEGELREVVIQAFREKGRRIKSHGTESCYLCGTSITAFDECLQLTSEEKKGIACLKCVQ